jgi:hypothetical protein
MQMDMTSPCVLFVQTINKDLLGDEILPDADYRYSEK